MLRTETIDDRGGSAPGVTAPRLIRVLEAERPLAPSSCHALAHTDEVTIGRGEPLAVERAVDGPLRRLTLRVPDRSMSARHARLVRVRDDWVLEDLGSKNHAARADPVEHEIAPHRGAASQLRFHWRRSYPHEPVLW